MEKTVFNWNLKEKPEDFIVSEVAELPVNETGNFYLYMLIKRNMNTKEIAGRYRLGYAGLKDKNALTFQYVSSERFLGDILREKKDSETFFILYLLGKITKRIKIGQLKGNRFSIKLKHRDIKDQDWFINYFDIQRLERNFEKGRKVLMSIPPETSWKKLSWFENFYIDAYLSYLWNKTLMRFLSENFEGYRIYEKTFGFFIPFTDYRYLMENIPKFWPILGYKVKMKDYEIKVYSDILKEEGIDLKEILRILKDLRIKGDYRKTFLRAEDLEIKGDRIQFFLPKGAYATMFLKHIFK
ncbi:MAG TPA: tRNA pseudouridine(13) synthase TruD [Persephonella sp.]|uniref:tRNA pseudouridine synthase D n=1 Tax=Persephonella marina (strain DSM 14350 / EX-H1) TaxID=123214 RepID=C0QS24_PERMH|nr:MULTISPECIES: tRNA pseudouridine(13) synthase TruD [Persephonella]ACO04091.1 tRNA pseudouridine synthase D [Persephonella marina EX-H1]HCB69215.1 tRNA pseudouridine(13) synthase TruD [Persephonella sp.]